MGVIHGLAICAKVDDLERPWMVKTHTQSPVTKLIHYGCNVRLMSVLLIYCFNVMCSLQWTQKAVLCLASVHHVPVPPANQCLPPWWRHRTTGAAPPAPWLHMFPFPASSVGAIASQPVKVVSQGQGRCREGFRMTTVWRHLPAYSTLLHNRLLHLSGNINHLCDKLLHLWGNILHHGP